MFCALCQEACPTYCLELTQDFELATYSRAGFVWNREMLEQGRETVNTKPENSFEFRVSSFGLKRDARPETRNPELETRNYESFRLGSSLLLDFLDCGARRGLAD